MISAARLPPSSIWLVCLFGSSRKIFAWSEHEVEKIIRRYVGRSAATEEPDSPMQWGQKENVSCKTGCKTTRERDRELSVGAGDRDRTDDIQLGKLTFYH